MLVRSVHSDSVLLIRFLLETFKCSALFAPYTGHSPIRCKLHRWRADWIIHKKNAIKKSRWEVTPDWSPAGGDCETWCGNEICSFSPPGVKHKQCCRSSPASVGDLTRARRAEWESRPLALLNKQSSHIKRQRAWTLMMKSDFSLKSNTLGHGDKESYSDVDEFLKTESNRKHDHMKLYVKKKRKNKPLGIFSQHIYCLYYLCHYCL